MHDAADLPESMFLGTLLPTADADLLRRTNPLTYLAPGLPPFLIQHGENDDLVPVEQSLLLADALRGADVSLDILAGAPHGGPAFETPENMRRVLVFLHRTIGEG